MAVDSALKRFSMVHVPNTGRVYPANTSGITQSERYAILGLYASGAGSSGGGAFGNLMRNTAVSISIRI